MKRTMNRLLVRFALLCVALILGAIAVAQAKRGMDSTETPLVASASDNLNPNQNTTLAAIPMPFQQDRTDWGAAEHRQSPQPPQSEYHEPATDFVRPIAAVRQYDEPEHEPDAEVRAIGDYSQPAAHEYADETPNNELATSQSEYYQPELAPTDYHQPELAPSHSEFQQPNFSLPVHQDAELALPESDNANFLPEEDYNTPVAAHQFDDPQATHQYIPPTLDASALDSPTPAAPMAASVMAAPTKAARESAPPQNFAQELTPQDAAPYATPTQFVNNNDTSLRPLQRQVPKSAGLPGSGKPGTTDLEGPQTPSLSIKKTAPDEIQVGKAAEFQVTVRNVGSTTARDVTIRDEVPFGTELVDTNPPANYGPDGELVWQIGEIQPGDEQTVSMQVLPQNEGEIGSVAQVYFAASVSAKSRCTRPQLTLEHTGPRQVLVGEDVIFKIKLHNPGTGIAQNVVIEEDVPAGLRHSAGKELEYPVGSLRPGETRLLELTLQADKPGMVDNFVVARADANLSTDHIYRFEVIAPLLQVAIQGPHRRYLERDATFEIAVQNPGTASSKNVDIVAHLPRGLKFQSADHQGEYNQQNHTVHWTLAELPANEMGTVQLTTMPTDIGDQKIRVEGNADMNLSHSTEHIVTVDGLAALLYTVKDLSDPVEVGGTTTYEVQVVNQGSKTATNLRLAAQAPAGMQPVNGDGPTQATVSGQKIVFAPLARLAPQGETSYRVNVKASQAGDMRLKFYLVSDEIQNAVIKEESTHVYSDE